MSETSKANWLVTLDRLIRQARIAREMTASEQPMYFSDWPMANQEGVYDFQIGDFRIRDLTIHNPGNGQAHKYAKCLKALRRFVEEYDQQRPYWPLRDIVEQCREAIRPDEGLWSAECPACLSGQPGKCTCTEQPKQPCPTCGL